MADKNAGAVEQPTAPQRKIKATCEPKYPLAALQKNCRKLFGVSAPTFAGAAAGIEAREYTINEMKAIIEKWCRQEVR